MALDELKAGDEPPATVKRKRTAAVQSPAGEAPAAEASPTATASAGKKKVAKAPAAAGCSTIVLQDDQSDEDEEKESDESDAAPARHGPAYENEESSESDDAAPARVPEVKIVDKTLDLTHGPLKEFVEKYGRVDMTIKEIWKTMRQPPHCTAHPGRNKTAYPSVEVVRALKMDTEVQKSGVTYETMYRKLKTFAA